MKGKLFLLPLLLCLSLRSTAQLKWQKLNVAATTRQAEVNDDKNRPYHDKDYAYGAEGMPSARTDAVSWSDGKGNFWFFGGVGWDENFKWGVFQDFWRFDGPSQKWSLVKGKRNVSYAQNDSKADSEVPLPRKNAVAWIDPKGNLWMFGGQTFLDFQYLDDVWVFDTGKGSWSKARAEGKINSKASYGDKKTFNETNQPGSRAMASYWNDAEGNLWLFGGTARDESQANLTALYSDLWQFNIQKSQWVWLDGEREVNPKIQKNKDVDVPVAPSPRLGGTVWYHNKSGQAYLFGGYGFDQAGAMTGGLSDLWAYSPKSNTWQLLSKGAGLNTEAETFTYESKENTPGFRVGAAGWTDSKASRLFLLGGQKRIGPDTVSTDSRLWCYEIDGGYWHTEAVTGLPAELGRLNAFKNEKEEIFIMLGEEFYEEAFHFRPSNTIWKLSR